MNALLLLFALTTFVQEPPQDAGADRVVPQSLDYRVGPGDVLTIRVSGVREFDQAVTVSNSGRMRVPYVGVMFVAGMSPVEIARDIAALIKTHELVAEPSVRVQVTQYRAQPTYVIGEVTTPGQFIISGEMHVLDLIARAGGLLGTANTTALLYRRKSARPMVEARIISGIEDGEPGAPPPAGAPQVSPNKPSEAPDPEAAIPIDLEGLRKGTRPDLNVKLQGGDVLYVPRQRQQNFYIIGDVQNPGAYAVPRHGKITAAQAVIYAGGTLRTAKNGKGFLMRYDQQGMRQSMPVDFSAIIAGKKPDLEMRPDDIIFIPNSAAKTIGLSLLDMVPLMIQQWLIF